MIGFSIIGTPNGFEMLNAGINENLQLREKVDLDNSVINIFPETDILMAHREIEGDTFRYYFVYYRFAREMGNTPRTGSYYGSVVVLQNSYVEPYYILRVLYDLAEIVRANCLEDDNKFHRDIKNLTFNPPNSINNLANSKIELPKIAEYARRKGFFFIGSNQEIGDYENFLLKFLNDFVLAEFQTLYASQHLKVSNYVKELKTIPILNLTKLNKDKEVELEIKRKKELEEKRKIELENARQQMIEAKRQKEMAETSKKLPIEIKDYSAKEKSNNELWRILQEHENRLRHLENKHSGNFNPVDSEYSKTDRIKERFLDFYYKFQNLGKIWKIIIIFLLILLISLICYGVYRSISFLFSSKSQVNPTIINTPVNPSKSEIGENKKEESDNTKSNVTIIKTPSRSQPTSKKTKSKSTP
jgi:hypothetical protein